MEKDFDTWNKLKKGHEYRIRENNVYFKVREVWWAGLGLNLGDEEDGKGDLFERPVLIIKKFNNNLFWCCSLSTKIKPNNKYYIPINTKLGVRSVVISQLRLLDSKRLRENITTVDISEYEKIKTAIKALL